MNGRRLYDCNNGKRCEESILFCILFLISCKNNLKDVFIRDLLTKLDSRNNLTLCKNAQVNTCSGKADRFIYKFRGFVNVVFMRIRREIVKCFYLDECFSENILMTGDMEKGL